MIVVLFNPATASRPFTGAFQATTDTLPPLLHHGALAVDDGAQIDRDLTGANA